MTQVIRTNGDYKIQATNAGSITLDSTNVVVTGNLTVEGSRTDVNVNNLYIEDNIININTGETSNGISLLYAGIEINRGSANNVAILYNETSSAWEFVENAISGYVGTNSTIKVRSIITDASVSSGDLALIGNHIGVVTVPTIEAPNDYTTQIRNRGRDDDIPNKGYVDYAVANADPQSAVGSGDTVIIARDKDVINDGVSISSIDFAVDGQKNLFLFADKTLIHNLEFRSNIIENNTTADNIRLVTNGTGKIETNFAIQIDQILTASEPSAVAGTAVIYSKAPGAADSGIFFVNNSKRDELISKNKALVFSMLF